jgi:hypothetical protein
VLGKLDAFFVGLLLEIPASAEPGGSEIARSRLYSAPSDDAKINAEWLEYVQPDLQHLFQSANATVKQDLERLEKSMEETKRRRSLCVPPQHFDSWLCSLNQARLTLAARFDFTDTELAASAMSDFGTERNLKLFQIHFYGFLQECLIREINGPE